jgi:uncharacterized protein YkwD
MINKKLALSVAVLGMIASSFTTTVSAEKTLYLPGQNPETSSQVASTNTLNAPSYENGVRVMSFGGFKSVSSVSSSSSNFQNLSFSSTTSSSTSGVREMSFGGRQALTTTSSSANTTSGFQFGNAFTGGISANTSSSSYSSSSTGIRNISFGGSNASTTTSNQTTTATQSTQSNPWTTNECSSSYANEMLASINQFRSQNGVGALTLAGDLNNIACAHSKWQNTNNIYEHIGYQGSTPFERCQKAGTTCDSENVYWSTQPTVNGAMNWLKNSPIHRTNMLYPEFKTAGFSLYGNYTTQLFRR